MNPKPTDALMHEHKVILMVLSAAEAEADRIEATGQVRAERVAKMVEFFRHFADRCHHAKEEQHLFVKLHERGMPADSGPIAVMLREHDQGRKLVTEIERTLDKAREGDRPAVLTVRKKLLAYADLLRNHIAKEDNVLYPMANRLFSEADQEALAQEFERVEAEEMGEGTHEQYHRLAHELAEE